MRYTLLRLVLLGYYNSYLKETSVSGSETVLSHLRRGNSVTDHKEKEETTTLDDNTEPGFDLDEREMEKFHIWPNGMIPYYIDDFSYDKVLRDTIRAFLDHSNRITGLQFLELPRPPKDNSRWVFFINRQGLLECDDRSFWNFTHNGVQKVILGYDCITNYGIIKTVLMLVGVPPQHNSPNRDDFVQVQMKNVMPNKKHLFDKLKDNEWLFHDLEYDLKSAGHYDSHKFTVNGKATITPQENSASNLEIGFEKCFSIIDIKKIKMLYNYISKKSGSILIPECSKIFNPGSNPSNNHENTVTELKPRNKPRKYLGLPEKETPDVEEEDMKANSESKQVNNTNKNITPGTALDISGDGEQEEVEEQENLENEDDKKDVEKVIDENVEVDDSKEENIPKTENHSADNVNKDVQTRVTVNKTSLNFKKNVNDQNLLDLSDFATGEDT